MLQAHGYDRAADARHRPGPSRPDRRGALRRADGELQQAAPAGRSPVRGGRALSGTRPHAGEIERRAQPQAARQGGHRDRAGSPLLRGPVLPRAGRHLVWSMLQPTRACARAAGRVPGKRRRRPRRGPRHAPRPRRRPRDAQRPPPERRGRRHAADHRGGGRPGAARSRRRGGRDPRRGRQPSALRRRARLRRRASTSRTSTTGGSTSSSSSSRDLGYVNKIFRGRSRPPDEPSDREALGGGGRDVRDRRRLPDPAHGGPRDRDAGARLYLPARKEGIIPGASNLRLPRSVGDRLARQAILSGLELEAGDAARRPALRRDRRPGEMDAAIAAASRGADELRARSTPPPTAARSGSGPEPLDLFREYMATFCREQAYCHLSPALVRNLEEHWNAARAPPLRRRSGTRSEPLPRQELAQLQLERLRATVARVSQASRSAPSV